MEPKKIEKLPDGSTSMDGYRWEHHPTPGDVAEKVDEIIDVLNQMLTIWRVESMKVMLDPGAKMPTLAHEDDAGLDLYARETQVVPARGSAKFDTGVHMAIPHGCAGILMSKSGLNVKHNLTGRGLIDCGYTGSIVVKLDNHSDHDYTVEAGQKISQLVIVPILRPDLEIVDSLEETERGAGGFGSSGK